MPLDRPINALSRIKSNLLLRAGLGLTLANVTVGLLGYAYQVLMGRMLEPAEFALFGAIMALFMFFSAPTAAMSLLISRQVSKLRVLLDSSRLMRKFYFDSHKFSAIAGICIFVLFFLCLENAQEYLKTETQLPLLIFAVAIVANAFFTINNAYFQGMQKFGLLGAALIASILLKIILGYMFVAGGFGASGALGGLLVSIIIIWTVSTATSMRMMPRNENIPTDEVKSDFPWITILPVVVANLAFAAMTQLDMVLVKHYFSAEQAGVYLSASILGKAVLYLPGGLVMALFPMVAEDSAKGQSSAHMLIQAVLVTGIVCLFIAILYWLFGEWLVLQLYGQKYQGAGELLRWYGFAMLPMALVMIAEYFLIAKGRVLFAWLFLCIAPLQLVTIHLWHDELWMIVATISVFGAVSALVGYTLLWREYKSA